MVREITREELITLLGNLKGDSWSLQRKINKMIELVFSNAEDVPKSIDWYLDGLEANRIINRPVSDLYEDYSEWSKLNYFTPESKRIFSKYVCEKYYVESSSKWVNGKNQKCYVKK